MKCTHQRLLTITQILNAFQVDGKDEDGAPKSRKIPIKMAYAIRVTRKRIEAILKDYNETRAEAALEFVSVGKDGKMKTDEDGNMVFKSKKSREAWAEKHLELLTEKVSLDVHKVTMATMEQLGEIEEPMFNALAFMIEGLEEDELTEEDNGEEAVEEAETEGA